MAIIELAHITLTNGVKATDLDLKKNLKEVKRVIEEYSKLTTLFYTQVDDPTVMFVIGAWESQEKHQHGFDGSPQQGEILKLIKDQMGIDWMHYMDVEQSQIPLDAPVLAIVKETFAKHGVNKTQFDQDFAHQTPALSGARFGAVAAWNLKKNKHERDVRMHFSGWQDVDEATGAISATIENFQRARANPADLNFFFVKQTVLD
jgi:hypothetical protein